MTDRARPEPGVGVGERGSRTTAPSGRIRPREAAAIVASLRAGVVPRVGQQHIQVGRVAEVQAMITDITRVADGGAACRFIIGEYGSGKTFFLHQSRPPPAKQPGRVSFVHHQPRPVPLLQIDNSAKRREITIHRENALRHD